MTSALPGKYTHYPIENDWHQGHIIMSDKLKWGNKAGVSWGLEATGGDILTVDESCPCQGKQFTVYRDEFGQVTGFTFEGSFYVRELGCPEVKSTVI